MITISHTLQPQIAKILLMPSQNVGILSPPLPTKLGTTIVFARGWNRGQLNSMPPPRKRVSWIASKQTGTVRKPIRNLPGNPSKTGSSIRIPPLPILGIPETDLAFRWSESYLKSLLDKHGIPCPQPRTRDTLIAKARENYESIRKSAGDAAAMPGNWLYDAWSDSDLKSWCDYRGIPVPQGSKRNEV